MMSITGIALNKTNLYSSQAHKHRLINFCARRRIPEHFEREKNAHTPNYINTIPQTHNLIEIQHKLLVISGIFVFVSIHLLFFLALVFWLARFYNKWMSWLGALSSFHSNVLLIMISFENDRVIRFTYNNSLIRVVFFFLVVWCLCSIHFNHVDSKHLQITHWWPMKI